MTFMPKVSAIGTSGVRPDPSAIEITVLAKTTFIGSSTGGYPTPSSTLSHQKINNIKQATTPVFYRVFALAEAPREWSDEIKHDAKPI